MSIAAKPLKANEYYTYSDYQKWPEYPRYELHDGIAVIMETPTYKHQDICGEIFVQLANFLRGKTCKVFIAPCDVRLGAEQKDDIVLQPDILVICDLSKIKDGKSCKGAPDFVAEVISPTTAGRDRLRKFNYYLNAGVREYWIVDPDGRNVSVHLLDGEKYIIQMYGEDDKVPVSTLEGCTIDFNNIFPPDEGLETEETQ